VYIGDLSEAKFADKNSGLNTLIVEPVTSDQ
jgi:hypothetical protein